VVSKCCAGAQAPSHSRMPGQLAGQSCYNIKDLGFDLQILT
jgi:hypothetical protein